MVIAEEVRIKITYGALFATIGALIGFMLWITNIANAAQAANDRLDMQAEGIKDVGRKVSEMDKRTIRMETILERIDKKIQY